MKPIFLRVIAVVVGLSLFTGCAPWHSYSHKVEPVDLKSLNSFYVVHNPDDSGELGDTIKNTIESMGFQASIGNAKDMPQDIDMLVNYEFHWFWDITNYLLMLKILVRDADTKWPLAMGESVRPSLARKSPTDMSKEILEPLFNPAQ